MLHHAASCPEDGQGRGIFTLTTVLWFSAEYAGNELEKKRYKLLKVNNNILPHNGYAL